MSKPIKFNILYTTRLVQKQKKWKDGTLILTHAHYEIRDEDNAREIAGPFPLSSSAYTDPESQVGEQMRLGSYMIDFQSVKEEDDSNDNDQTDVAIAITEKVMKRPLTRHVGPMKRRKPLLSTSSSNKPLLSTITPPVIQKQETNEEKPTENIAPSNYLVSSDENPMRSPSKCVGRSMDDLLSMLKPEENTTSTVSTDIKQQKESEIPIIQANSSPDIVESTETVPSTPYNYFSFPLQIQKNLPVSPSYQTKFDSVEKYVKHYSSLIYYHINKDLYSVSQKLLNVQKSVISSQAPSNANQKYNKSLINFISQSLKNSKIYYNTNCELIVSDTNAPAYNPNNKKKYFQYKKQKEEEEKDNCVDIDSLSFYIKFPFNYNLPFPTELSPGDLYIILPSGLPLNQSDNIHFCYTDWYSISSNSNMLHIIPIKNQFSLYKKESGIDVLYIGNYQNEITELNMLNQLTKKIPLFLPLILGNNDYDKPIINNNSNVLPNEIMMLYNEILNKYKLNKDQSDSLLVSAKWCLNLLLSYNNHNNHNIQPTIHLIHGVFGSGKTYYIIILLIFISTILDYYQDKNVKILICCNTNIAVDRILLGLLTFGYKNISRVGCLRRINPLLLPFVCHNTDKIEDDIKSLNELLQLYKPDSEEYKNINNAIKQSNTTIEKQNKLLKSNRIMGTTFVASQFPILSNTNYPIVIIDEASQITEPMNLLPLIRFNCRHFTLIGDSKQLSPPTYENDNLKYTLFDRLQTINYIPQNYFHVQYRCHPVIGQLSNQLFYSNQLQHGTIYKPSDMLISEWPPILLYNCNGIEKKCQSGSYVNQSEVNYIQRVVNYLIKTKEIDSSSIGIISLYTAQVKLLESVINDNTNNNKHSNSNKIMISTVDAFQGDEKEIIIVSTVRSQYLGFIINQQRINVCITRAKQHLVIVGKKTLLMKNKIWNSIVSYIQQNGEIYEDSSIFNSIYKYPQVQSSSIRIEQSKAIMPIQTEEKIEDLSDNDSDTTIEDTQSCHKPPPSDISIQLDEEDQDLFSL